MSRRELNKVYWREVLIGHTGELKYDMFDVYGPWLPQPGSSAYEDFLRTLREDREVVYVTVERPGGTLTRYRITAEPDDDGINFKTI